MSILEAVFTALVFGLVWWVLVRSLHPDRLVE